MIHVDDEVLAALGVQARPFIDTEPNHVLRRVLGLSDAASPVAAPMFNVETEPVGATTVAAAMQTTGGRRRGAAKPKEKKARSRARKGTLLDETAYWTPILRALEEKGGRLATSEVVERVGELIDDQLLPADRELLETGGVRWQARTQFARLRMKEEGLVAADSPRGVWEITDLGRQRLTEAATAAE